MANVITVSPLPFAKSIDAALEVSVPPSTPSKFCGSPVRFDHAVAAESVVMFNVLESLPFANKFSPRTFSANEVLLANPLYVYDVVTLLFPILPDAFGKMFVCSVPSLNGAYCLVTVVSPTILIVIEVASFDVSLIVGVAGVLLLTFETSPLLSISNISFAVVST